MPSALGIFAPLIPASLLCFRGEGIYRRSREATATAVAAILLGPLCVLAGVAIVDSCMYEYDYFCDFSGSGDTAASENQCRAEWGRLVMSIIFTIVSTFIFGVLVCMSVQNSERAAAGASNGDFHAFELELRHELLEQQRHELNGESKTNRSQTAEMA